MDGLSFGEQVKIILSRKNMTIKELAERIEEHTGKAMSRQNLTQRLGRDNFQEQDMRMIAEILGCPFRLSIFPVDEEEDEKMMAYANVGAIKKRARNKRDEEFDLYQQTMVFNEETQEVKTMSGAELKAEEEHDMTIGELYGIHEELDELEAEAAEKEAAEQAAREAAEREAAEQAAREAAEREAAEKAAREAAEREAAEKAAREAAKREAAEQAAREAAEREAAEQAAREAAEREAAEREAAEQAAREAVEKEAAEKAVVEETQKEGFHSGGLFFRRKRKSEEPKREEVKVEEKKPSRPVITPESEDFEPVIKHEDMEEDLEIGEVNPYTGHEYQTNSVKTHPNRIGYVQVYDRRSHRWTDMTEWAFLAIEERKKALQGKDYEPPIYLD